MADPSLGQPKTLPPPENPPSLVAMAGANTGAASDGGQSATNGGEKLDSAPPQKALNVTTAANKWRKAGNTIVMTNAITRNFKTLRDQYGINEIDPMELKLIKKLGEGAFATVEKCLYTPRMQEGAEERPSGGVNGDSAHGPSTPARKVTREVAVKKLKPEIVSNDSDLDSFMSEVALMRKLRHKYIVEYIGIGSSDSSTPELRRSTMFMVSELMEGGTLKRTVMNQMSAPHSRVYSFQDALRWCMQVAEALSYLHSVNPMVIHRDLKLENILLTTLDKERDRSKQEAKLVDFGLVAFVKSQSESKRHGLSRNTTGKRDVAASPDARLVAAALAATASVDDVEVELNQRHVMLTNHLSGKARSLAPDMTGITGSVVQTAYSSKTSAKSGKISLSPQASGQFNGIDLPQARALMTGQTGTLMYMSPEMYLSKEYDEKVDVFSFAICMYELLHKYMMVFAVSNKGTEEEIEQYAERVAAGYRPPIREDFPEELRAVIREAWAQNPKARPSMAEIARRLREILDLGLVDKMDEAADSGCGCGGCAVM